MVSLEGTWFTRRRRLRGLRVALFIACVGPIAVAQDGGLPLEYTNSDPAAWLSPEERIEEPWWHENLDARFRSELREGRTLVVLRALDEELAGVDLQPELKQRFKQHTDLVIGAFAVAMVEVGADERIDTNDVRSAILVNLASQGLGTQSLLPQLLPVEGDDFGSNALEFFPGAAYAIPTVGLVDDDLAPLLEQEDLRTLLLASHAFSYVLRRFADPLQDAQYDALVEADEMWRNYLFEGYSQYPWEAAFNGLVLDPKPFEPPSSQWILLHPTVGVAFSTESLDDIRAKGTLNVELLGWLKYRDHNKRYLGGSVAASFREDLGPGIGVLAHWTKGFSLGAAWHDTDDDDNLFNDSPFVYLSFDLYRYVQGELPRFQEAYGRIESLLDQFE